MIAAVVVSRVPVGERLKTAALRRFRRGDTQSSSWWVGLSRAEFSARAALERDRLAREGTRWGTLGSVVGWSHDVGPKRTASDDEDEL